MKKIFRMCSLAFSALMILGLLVACANSGGGDNGGSGADNTPLFDKTELEETISDSSFTLDDGSYKYKKIDTSDDGSLYITYYEFYISGGVLTITKGSQYSKYKLTEEMLEHGPEGKPISREDAIKYIESMGGKVDGDIITYSGVISADQIKDTERYFKDSLESNLVHGNTKTNANKTKFYYLDSYDYGDDDKGKKEVYLLNTSAPKPVQTTQQNAVYVCERTDTNPNLGLEVTTKLTATFKNDGTFSVSQKMKMGEQESDFGVVMKGTYTGNAAVDGTVTITITHMMNDDGELAAYTDSDATQTVTISNGKCTFDGMEFTRQ